jgi:hypothetical protein
MTPLTDDARDYSAACPEHLVPRGEEIVATSASMTLFTDDAPY